MNRHFSRLTLAATLLLWSAVGASAQLFYTCQVIVPNPPATQFHAPAASATNCPLDAQRLVSGAGVGLVLNFSTGAVATASVQVTGDANPGSATAVWNNHDYLVNETGSINGNIIFPVTAVRLYLTSYTSGTITLDIVQPAR